MEHPETSHDFFKTMRTAYGKLGEQWIDTLSERITICAEQWKLTDLVVGKHLSYHYIIVARRQEDGTSVIIKLGLDAQNLFQEQTALELYKGYGCVRILVADTKQQALLLEHLIPGTSLMSLFPHDDSTAVEHTVALIKKLHSTQLPTHHTLPTTAELLATLNYPIEGIRAYHLDKAQRIAHELIASQPEQVLLHGDLHQANILKGAHGWCAIDPKGIVGDPAYDVGPFIRNPTQQLIEHEHAASLIQNRITQFSLLMNIDYERIKAWCYVQSIMAAYWHVEDQSDQDTIDDCLRMAELIEQL